MNFPIAAPPRLRFYLRLLTGPTVLTASALLLALSLSACQSEGSNVGVTVGDLEENPEQYASQRVTVSGDIDDRYSSSFTIGGEGFGGELLIIVPPDAQISGGRAGDQPYADDDIVQVTGTVRQYVVADLESDLGLSLDTDIDYEGEEPTVVAESIAITPRTSGAANQMRDLGGQRRDVRGEGTPATDLSAVIVDLPAYEGRPVAVDSVEVREVISDSTFWVGPTGESDPSQRLFVFLNEAATPDIPTEGRYDIEAGQTISLQGSLRPLPAMEQVRQRLGDLSDETQSQLQNQEYYLWAQRASDVDGSE